MWCSSDRLGAGGSDIAAYDRVKYGTLDGYATDVLELCEELALEDVVFVAHSVGAMIGVLVARQQPARFDGLVLVGPSPRYVNDDGYHGGFSRADVEELLSDVQPVELSDLQPALTRVLSITVGWAGFSSSPW